MADLDRDQIELITDNKILEAKLSIAEKRLHFLLALGAFFLTVFGIALPLYQTNQAKEEVQVAINKMEERFDKLAGKELRKPDIECYYEGKPLKYSSLVISPTKDSGHILFKNIGNGTADLLRISLYVNNIENINFNNFFGGKVGPEIAVDRSDYDSVFLLQVSSGLSPEETFRLDYDFYYNRADNVINEDKKIPALFVVYYGETEPIEIPLTLVIKKEKT